LGVVAVRGKAITPQTVEAGRSVGVIVREVDEPVLGLGSRSRRRTIAAARAGSVHETVYIL
jgi:hypothetical protein